MKRALSFFSAFAFLVCADVAGAQAETFNITGTVGTVFDNDGAPAPATFSGSMDLNTVTGTINSIAITFAGYPTLNGATFEDSALFGQGTNGATLADGYELYIDVSTLVGFTGASIDSSQSAFNAYTDCNCGSAFVYESLTGSITPAATPLPAALPLFATGLGALGLFGWRRKRNCAALAGA